MVKGGVPIQILRPRQTGAVVVSQHGRHNAGQALPRSLVKGRFSVDGGAAEPLAVQPSLASLLQQQFSCEKRAALERLQQWRFAPLVLHPQQSALSQQDLNGAIQKCGNEKLVLSEGVDTILTK